MITWVYRINQAISLNWGQAQPALDITSDKADLFTSATVMRISNPYVLMQILINLPNTYSNLSPVCSFL